MDFTGRSRELGALRAALDNPVSSVVRVTGLPGVGKSELVRRAIADYRGFVFRCPPLPDDTLHRAFAKAWLARPEEFEDGFHVMGVGSWSETLRGPAEEAATPGRPWVLVLDDAERLVEGRARIGTALAEVMSRLDAGGTPFHVILVSRDADALKFPALEDRPSTHLAVPPLTLRAAAPWLPGKRPEDRLRAYGVFGGTPAAIRCLDPSVTVGNNVRRLLLSESGSLSESPLLWVERVVQTPARYMAILRTLSWGESDWAQIHAGLPDLTRSGQVAPYLSRLESLGFIERRRSLDATPRSRATRYRIVDPLIAFWFRFVLPWRMSSRAAPIGEHYTERIRRALHPHMDVQVLPVLARQYMARAAIESLGASARECGSLWNTETEIPVAGTLSTGAAFYGAATWEPANRGDSPLSRIDAQIRTTRYGFGREGRHRVIFTGRPPPNWLRREVVRRHDAHLVDAEMLLGEKDGQGGPPPTQD